ncbi:uncharacterized protein LOC144737620 isoform X2 [Lampetra planeri]
MQIGVAAIILAGLLPGALCQSHAMPSCRCSTDGYRVCVKTFVEAEEGSSVVLPCSFSYPAHSPPSRVTVSWKSDMFRDRIVFQSADGFVRESLKGRLSLVGDLNKNDASISIRDVNINDFKSYTCQPVLYYENRDRVVQVSDAIDLDMKGQKIVHNPSLSERTELPQIPEFPTLCESPRLPAPPKIPEPPKLPEPYQITQHPKTPAPPKIPEPPKLPEPYQITQHPKTPAPPKITEPPKIYGPSKTPGRPRKPKPSKKPKTPKKPAPKTTKSTVTTQRPWISHTPSIQDPTETPIHLTSPSMPSTPSPTFLQVTIIPVIATVLGSFLFLLVLVVSVWARRAKKRRAGDKFSARQAPSTELQQLSLRNVDSAARKELCLGMQEPQSIDTAITSGSGARTGTRTAGIGRTSQSLAKQPPLPLTIRTPLYQQVVRPASFAPAGYQKTFSDYPNYEEVALCLGMQEPQSIDTAITSGSGARTGTRTAGIGRTSQSLAKQPPLPPTIRTPLYQQVVRPASLAPAGYQKTFSDYPNYEEVALCLGMQEPQSIDTAITSGSGARTGTRTAGIGRTSQSLAKQPPLPPTIRTPLYQQVVRPASLAPAGYQKTFSDYPNYEEVALVTTTAVTSSVEGHAFYA